MVIYIKECVVGYHGLNVEQKNSAGLFIYVSSQSLTVYEHVH